MPHLRIPNGEGGCFPFVEPIENFLGWTDPKDDPERVDDLRISVDYAGLADRWLFAETGGAQSFGTRFSGYASEVALGNGLTRVRVLLFTSNALTWVAAGDNFNNDLVFGARAPDVLNGASPALGHSLFVVEFNHVGDPGDPLPDLLQLLISPNEGEEVLSMRFAGWARGEDADGSPALAAVHQVAPDLNEPFVVERVDVIPVRRARH